MRARALFGLGLLLASACVIAQTPSPTSLYISSNGTQAGPWNPFMAAAGSDAYLGGVPAAPPAAGLYYSSTGLQAGPWFPCTLALCFGGGGGGSTTLETNGVANTSQTLLNFVNPATFNGLTFTFSNPTGGNETFALGGTLGNAGLTNSATTVNGQTCTLGSTCTVTVTFDQIGSGTNLGHGLVCGTGCVTSTAGTGVINANELNGVLLSGLATGLLKITTGTGVPSIATAGTDYLTPTGSGTGLTGVGLTANPLSQFAATTSAQLAGVISDETGTGLLVFGTAPTITLANGTGLPISTGVSGLGTGVATFLATPSSANLATAVSDETGSAALVFANTPTLVTPVLGVATATSINGTTIPSSVTLTQKIASGTSAMGTGAISSATCATVVTTTATGTATTDPIEWGFNGDPTGVTGYAPVTTGALTIFAYPSSGNVNFKVCNLTTASITPGAITLNWRVDR